MISPKASPKMPGFKYLKREKKTGFWTYRRPIPPALQAFAGKKEKSISFGTDDLRMVAKAWPEVHVQVEAWLAELSAARPTTVVASGHDSRVTFRGGPTPLDRMPLIDPRQCYLAFDRWVEEEINRIYVQISSMGPEFELFSSEHHQLADLAHALQSRDPRDLRSLDAQLRDVLASAHIDMPYHSPALSLLRRPFAEAWAKVIKFRLEMNASPQFVVPPNVPSRALTQAIPEHAPNGEPFLLLSELVQKATKHNKIGEKKTIARLNLVVRHLNDIVGRPARLNDVTKQVMIRLRDDARFLPARPKGHEKLMGFKKLVEVMKANPHDARPKMKDEAILPWFNLISPVFDYAVDHEYLASNPCTRIKPKVGKARGSKRDSYTSDDLHKLFVSPARERPSQFWIPLIGAFSGARLNEIGQLEKDDVVAGEVPYLRITDRSEEETIRKKLKNSNSRRIVPIHPVLLEAGLLEFARQVMGPHLFDDLPHPRTDDDYECTKAFSQWYGRYRRRVGVTSDRKPFHSFRHTFIRRAMDCSVDGPLLSQIVGHESDPELQTLLSSDMTRAYGGVSEDLKKLRAEIDKLFYPNFPQVASWERKV
jgi:integrase